MSESPLHPHAGLKEDQPQEDERTQRRLCDFCGNLTALLYCRADSAKLCIACDREVHSTNQLFAKHARSLLCDACDSSPASIFCSTESSVLCQNCDWERHSLSLSSIHDRRPIEGYTGRPSVNEFLGFVGLEDLGKKALFGGDGWVGSGDYRSMDGLDGFSDLLVWETPSITSLDDLIISNDSGHSFQAMGVPPLPKNRNAVCGQRKEEILCQLREMAKSESNFNNGRVDIEPLIGLQSLVPEENLQQGHTCASIEHNAEPIFVPSYEAKPNAFQWCCDTSEVADQGVPSTLVGTHAEKNHLVPDKDSDVCDHLSHTNGNREGQSYHPISVGTVPDLPRVFPRELNSQERDSAISRYKEKKKTRRYDKHVRYESRKVRAESRTRIKGRFAKVDHSNIGMR